jgi:hypothetical protein
MIKYIFKEDGPIAIKNLAEANPQKIGETLAKLTNENKGHLTPQNVVAEARDIKSPLHKHFEWDDIKAADAFRLDQAREIIRVVRVIDEDKKPVRAFLSIKDKDGVSYRDFQTVSTSSELQLAILRQAERDLEAWENRYKQLQELCEAVSIIREKAIEKRKQLENRIQ